MTHHTLRSVDPRRFRDALGHYASGVAVITGADEHGPIGFTCQSFYSVSAEPPLVSFSVMKSSTTYPRIAQTGKFSINVLAHDQQHLSGQFSRRGTDKWDGVEWDESEQGNPIIAGSLMWIDCEAWAEHDAGDHRIVVGRVVDLSPEDWSGGDPLLFFKGAYRHLRDSRA